MTTPHSLWYRVRALVSKPDVERDIADELAFHSDMETERQVANGVEPSRARAQAMRAFGDATRVREPGAEAQLILPIGAGSTATPSSGVRQNEGDSRRNASLA